MTSWIGRDYFELRAATGWHRAECDLNGCYLLAFMHIVSGVFSGCNSHTIASSVEADVQRFSPRLSVRVTSRLLGELCKEWFLDTLDFYTFSILFLCSARANTTHYTLQPLLMYVHALFPLHFIMCHLVTNARSSHLVENGRVVDEQRSVHYLATFFLSLTAFAADVFITF